MFLRRGCGLLVDEISTDQIKLAGIRGQGHSVLSPPDHMLRKICEHVGYGHGVDEGAGRQVERLDVARDPVAVTKNAKLRFESGTMLLPAFTKLAALVPVAGLTTCPLSA
jgi:hypothetical protein